MRGGAVEAVGADVVARQADGFDKRLEFGELERVQAELVRNQLHHALVLGRIGDGIGLDAFVIQRPTISPSSSAVRRQRRTC